MWRTKQFFALLVAFTLLHSGKILAGKNDPKEGPIKKLVKGFKKYPGFFDFYWDESTGSIFLEIDEFDKEFLYVYGLAAGVGSNDLGLDRGQLARERILKFIRSGPKVMLLQPNYDFRATSDNELEVRAVEEAFASSIWWGFSVEAEEDGKVLINITDFLIRDSHGVAERLAAWEQGNYSVDPSRSAIYLERTKNFPKNSEFEAIVTLKGQDKGYYIRSVTPYAKAVTVRNHHSFVELPDRGYKERDYDIRSGFNYINYQDFGTRISEPLVQRKLVRHRLEKKDPNAGQSEVVEPIIYYLDQGAPEPIRSALLDGAGWWAEAFDKAGFKDGFQVQLLPDTIDPLDIRYNVIQWIHRSTRGWSYGNSIIDPRTGEIIKGHVSLGSQRVRQDFLIAVGLLGPYNGGDPSEAEAMALARLRQLSAHEVGHTLGLMHNFAASVNDRASVMDYPHPLIKMNENGEIDLSDAYDVGVGEWDKWAIKFGYAESESELSAIMKERFEKNLLYISDMDARPLGGAHPYAHLWDNNTDPAYELDRLLEIRSKLLQDFDYDRVAENAPLATVEDALVPIYFMHRYQLEGTAKLIGGLDYSYSIKGDGQVETKMLEPEWQNRALESLMACILPENLSIPPDLLGKIPPRPPSYERGRENFPSRTGVMFDPLSAAETLADKVLMFLFNRERATRLEQFHAQNSEVPSFLELVERVINSTWKGKRQAGLNNEIQKATEIRVLLRLLDIAGSKGSAENIRSAALYGIKDIEAYCNRRLHAGTNDQDHYMYGVFLIEQFESDPSRFNLPPSPKMPDGSPIGMDCVTD